jgi:hypothetical protein
LADDFDELELFELICGVANLITANRLLHHKRLDNALSEEKKMSSNRKNQVDIGLSSSIICFVICLFVYE